MALPDPLQTPSRGTVQLASVPAWVLLAQLVCRLLRGSTSLASGHPHRAVPSLLFWVTGTHTYLTPALLDLKSWWKRLGHDLDLVISLALCSVCWRLRVWRRAVRCFLCARVDIHVTGMCPLPLPGDRHPARLSEDRGTLRPRQPRVPRLVGQTHANTA